jgi:hypothetical protein
VGANFNIKYVFYSEEEIIMTTVLDHCQVVFKNDIGSENPKKYTYLSNGMNLNTGDEVVVETNRGTGEAKAIFIHYIPSEFVGSQVMSKVKGKVAKLTDVKVTAVKGNRRTQQQIKNDSYELKVLLQESHPTMLSTRDIAKSMNWTLEQTPGFVKTALEWEDKIVQVYRGWYTSKL